MHMDEKNNFSPLFVYFRDPFISPDTYYGHFVREYASQ